MKKLLSILLFGFFVAQAFSTVINVPDDYITIQEGINASVNGDTVLVQPGTYFENINFNGKNIVVASLFWTTQEANYISQTIIDGNQNGSVITFNNDEDSTAVLSGFTITNGFSFYGGGIYCYNSNPTLTNLIITGNSAYCEGGGIFSYHHSNYTLINVTITDNSAGEEGGGIYCEASSPTLTNVVITGNSAGENGGGIFYLGGNPILTDVKLAFNSAYYAGGGIFSTNSNPILTNVTITDNSAYGGSGIHCSDYSNLTLSNVTITDNSAIYDGGGIHCDYCSNLTLSNVTITGNSAHLRGSGISCVHGSNLIFDTLNRCNIYNNQISNRGYGSDIFTFECETINVIVDTFTVLNPTDYYASPVNNLTFDILHGFQNNLINNDLYVSPDGDNTNSGLSAEEPLKTIKYALSKIYADSLNQHTIHLASGIYSPETNGEKFPLIWNSYVSLEGISPQETILDADSLSGVIEFYYVTNATIKNITIRNGYSLYSGGISCDSSNPTLTNVTITNNLADKGGGISCWNNSNPTLTNVTITNNSSYNLGGGIYCKGSNPTLTNVTITNNSANESGGGIYCEGSNPTLTNVTITNNLADEGGGISCWNNSNPTLTNVTITSNSADYGGGGISCDSSNPTLTNVIITSNSAYRGSGISCYYSNPTLTNVTITSNSAYWGGGIFCTNSNPILTNVTIIGNSASNGNGIYCRNNSNPELINSILWNNTQQEIYLFLSSITISYSDIQGGEDGIVTNDNGTVNWLEGNINADPLFADPLGHLSQNSPCIDAGAPDTTGLNLPPFDLDNNYRVFDGNNDGVAIIDMGAFEYGALNNNDDMITNISNYELMQNYPNPFNPRTKIDFSIVKPAKVKLTVYNMKGQKIKTLTNKSYKKGTYSVYWNGTNDKGKSVSSGIYFYKLDINGVTKKIKKCTLLK